MGCLRINGLWVIIVLTLLLLSGCDNSTSEQPLQTGSSENKVAKNFTLKNVQGEAVSLSQYRGKVVILNFWATWCPPCREEMPSMERLYQKYKGQDLVMLAVNVDDNSKQAVSKFLKRTPYSFPILLDRDSKVQNVYGVFRFPESFIIDRNGVVVTKIVGGRDWMSTAIFKLLDALIKSEGV